MLKSLFQTKVSSAKGQAQNRAMSGAQAIAGKTLVKYIFVFVLLFLLPAALCYFDFEYELAPTNFLIGIQIYAFILGVIHVWKMKQKFGWDDANAFWPRVWLTIFILFFGILFFGLAVWLSKFGWDQSDYFSKFYLQFPLGYLFFSLWLLMVSCFDFMIIMPDEEYKKWYYPEKMEMPDMDMIDFSNSYVLTYQIHKKENERDPTFMKFKAPLNKITFGEMFYMYIFEYNDRNRESMIEYMDKSQKRYGWLFYVKPKWWQSKYYIDPSLTVRENKIKERDIIVAYRAG